MKIIINNYTKDLTDATCLIKVYQFLTDTKIISELKEFIAFMAITFGEYVCIVRYLKNGIKFLKYVREQIIEKEIEELYKK